MKGRVGVLTNCRLHFGLTSLGHDADRPQFGGVGMMVQSPGVHVEVAPSELFTVDGLHAERVAGFVQTVAQELRLPALLDLRIHVPSAPREHVGLGVGTQLGLAVAAGIAEALGFPWRDPVRLAQLTGRGKRSAIGTYGFLMGGLIVDAGHLTGEPLGRLKFHGDVPSQWRFVLITPREGTGCSGTDEEKSMADMPPVPEPVTAEMNDIIDSQLVPALRAADFAMFGDALYRYGCLAGKCFAPAQGGIFSSKETAELIAWLRGQGIAGVGQSSWGPTVFALCADPTSAEHLVASLGRHPLYGQYSIQSAAPANTGAHVQ